MVGQCRDLLSIYGGMNTERLPKQQNEFRTRSLGVGLNQDDSTYEVGRCNPSVQNIPHRERACVVLNTRAVRLVGSRPAMQAEFGQRCLHLNTSKTWARIQGQHRKQSRHARLGSPPFFCDVAFPCSAVVAGGNLVSSDPCGP